MTSLSTAELSSPAGLPAEKVLVIEDDRSIQRVLRRLFESAGSTVQIANDAHGGLEAFRTNQPSVVILDLKLPDMPGQDVCRQIKQHAPSLPVIVLSAVTDVIDKVLLLELGADDYVTKPFSPRELLARARTALRKSQRSSAAEHFAFDNVAVDFSKMELMRAGQPVALTGHEFKLLRFFLQNSERVFSREELLAEVWGYQDYPSTRTVDNHVLRLRQKLEIDPANPVHIRTVHGIGYKFVP